MSEEGVWLAWEQQPLGKDTCRSHHWAGQGPPPGLVYSAHSLEALRPQALLHHGRQGKGKETDWEVQEQNDVGALEEGESGLLFGGLTRAVGDSVPGRWSQGVQPRTVVISR